MPAMTTTQHLWSRPRVYLAAPGVVHAVQPGQTVAACGVETRGVECTVAWPRCDECERKAER